MKDKFEDFVRGHREEFDEEAPRPDLWKTIERWLPQQKGGVVFMMKRHWLKAAVIILLVVNGALLLTLLHHRQTNNMAAIYPQLSEAQSYYTRQIDRKLSYIKSQPESELKLSPHQLKELEPKNETYYQLTNALKENPGNQRIEAAFIQYYRLKLDLLNKIIEEINNTHHEDSSTNVKQVI